MDLSLRTPVHLISNLSQEEVVSRLREATKTSWLSGWLPAYGAPLVGKVTDKGCRLSVTGRSRNRMQRELRLTFTETEYGTNLDGEFSTSAWAVKFVWIWFSVIAFVSIGAALGAIGDFFDGHRVRFAIVAPVGMLAFGYLILKVNLAQSVAWDEDSVEFLIFHLNAVSLHGADKLALTPIKREISKPVPPNTIVRPRHEVPEPQNSISEETDYR